MPLVTKTCTLCGTPFTRDRWQANKQSYCSSSCGAKARARTRYRERRVTKKCDYCQLEFSSLVRDKRHFCSIACANRSMNLRIRGNTGSPPVTKVCETCHREFMVKVGHAHKKHYCSRACYQTAMIHHIYSPCPICGKQVKSTQKNRHIYCSDTCFRLGRIDFCQTQKMMLAKILKISDSTNFEYEWDPDWLISAKGWQMHIDLMLHDLNLAIEYNGIYHYNSVAFLDKHDDLIVRQERDALKYELIQTHGINLLVWRYDEPRTTEYISHRLMAAIVR